MQAISERDAAAVQTLLDENQCEGGITANVNMKADGNETPLHGAVLVGYQPVVEVLLNMFAEPNAQNNEGKTALHFACMRGNFSITRLLASRPDVALNVQDSKGNSPFMIACNLLQE